MSETLHKTRKSAVSDKTNIDGTEYCRLHLKVNWTTHAAELWVKNNFGILMHMTFPSFKYSGTIQ